MKKIIESITRRIPRELKNAHVFKHQNIYIPYCEIGITCLTKNTAQISLFYETVLKFIDIGVNELYEMATIMGVEFKLLKEVIVDMIEEKYIITSQNKVSMTPKGVKALESRKVVTTRKTNINQIMVNMITGEIKENENIHLSNVKKYEIFLSEELALTKEFLDKNYASINGIYQKNQVEYSVFSSRNISRELYKILDIAYSRLVYVKEELLIYKNDDTGDHEFRITGDVGEQYINCFYKQIRDGVSIGLENLFEKDRRFSQNRGYQAVASREDRSRTEELVTILHNSDAITDDVREKFLQERALIDEYEIPEYFQNAKELEFDGIIISSNRLRRILRKDVISSINQIKDKKVVIFYEKDEFDIENFLHSNFGEMIKQNRMVLLKEKEIKNNFISFYPGIYIQYVENIEKIFDRPVSVFEGKILFDKKIIKDKLDEIINEYQVSF